MARRKGEGTVYQRERDGLWIGQATIAGRRKTVTGHTSREAQKALRKLLVDADRGVLPPSERWTLGQLIERWLSDVVQHTTRPRTYKEYRGLMDRHVLPELSTVALARLHAAHLQSLYSRLLERGLSPKTVRDIHVVLHGALKHAVRWNLVSRNVTDQVDPPRVKRDEIRPLNPQEVQALLASAKGTRSEALVTMAIATGARQGELLGLRWSDLDWDAGVVIVQRQLSRDGSFAEVKSGAGRRVIDLPASTMAVLRDHRSRQNEERLLAGPEWEALELVFCTYTGRPLNWRNVVRGFKHLLTVAGLRDIRFHDLRHTSATLLLKQGVHMKVVQERLGHASIDITMDTYSHLLEGMGREAAEKLNRMLI